MTRRANGLYLLTRHLPVIERVGNTDRQDAYARPGDPLAVNNLCEWSAEHVFGIKDLPHMQSVRVWLEGRHETISE